MSLLTCIEVSSLLEGRAAGLASAEAIRVEQHLQSCDDCRETDDYLRTFGELASAVPELEPRRSERALSLALALTTIEANRKVPIPRPKHHGPTDLRRVAAFGAGAALMATISVIIFAGELPDPRPVTPATHTLHEGLTLMAPQAPSSAAAARLGARHLEGSLRTADQVLALGASLPAGQTLHATTAIRLALPGGAIASLAEGSELQWQADRHALALGAGSARVLDRDGNLICELAAGELCSIPPGPEARER